MEVGPDQEGQRIDNFLLARLKGVPKSCVYRILRKGEVRVNRGRVRPDYRLKRADTVRIPPVRQALPSAPSRPGFAVLETVVSRILYEDKKLLVLNKPSGIAVHGGSGLNYGVIEALRVLRPEASFLELVHRLDRETSGCLLIAKRRSVLRALHALLREGKIDKRYQTLVAGRWTQGPCDIRVPLRKNTLRGGERIVRVDPTGKRAISRMRPITPYSGATLLEVRLVTGRTHQIRVHTAHAGHPVAGDEKYGDEHFNRRMRAYGLKRLFLHAHSLAFTLPGDERPVSLNAPLDEDLRAILERIGTE